MNLHEIGNSMLYLYNLHNFYIHQNERIIGTVRPTVLPNIASMGKKFNVPSM